MNITLTPEQERWVRQQVDAGHFATAEEAIGFAIDEAKRLDLRNILSASILRGGSHDANDVRRRVRSALDDPKAS
jgi:Arc/MetJ-type ribon-helix-helix transcriptional regulator